MHGFVEAQPFQVGKLQSGILPLRHLRRVVEGFKRHELCFRIGLDGIQQFFQRVARPGHHNRPPFHTPMPIDPFLDRGQLHQLIHREFARLVALAIHIHRPRRGFEVLRQLGRLIFPRSKFVVVVVLTDFVERILLFGCAERTLERGELRCGKEFTAGSKGQGQARDETSAIEINRLRGNIPILEVRSFSYQHVGRLQRL